ncbi:MAG: hypothetical protein FWD14_06390 [Treponema sp.]|nr:hypothetical protein [Treponema sp.]
MEKKKGLSQIAVVKVLTVLAEYQAKILNRRKAVGAAIVEGAVMRPGNLLPPDVK